MRSESAAPKRLEIGVLYGLRVLMVLFVANYHIWQQGWLAQHVTWFGRVISFDFWTRSSYVFVDGMILLSGFLLYLPFARQPLEGTPVPTTKAFYVRRASRILPSYLAAVLLALVCIAIPQKLYVNGAAMAHDIAAHLTFTFLFWPQTYIGTPLNVALWTICVEMQFYLLFPLLARAMQRRPAATALLMAATGWIYRFCVSAFAADTSMLLNQLPAFMDVYALGFAGAALYVRARLWMQRASGKLRAVVHILCAGVSVACVFGLVQILQVQSASGADGYAAMRLSQMAVRLPLSMTLLCFMLSAAFWPSFLQKLLDNRLMRFLSGISMNLYIWHQVLSVEMRKAWFDTDVLHTTPPMQKAYTLMCFAVALLAAMAFTYGLEQPAAKWIQRRMKRSRSA